MEFKECKSCSEKPGTPVLCESCINNRRIIEDLKQEVQRLFGEHDETRKILAKRTASLHTSMEMVIEMWEAARDE